MKKARGASSDAAKAALDRATIVDDVSSGRIKIDTKVEKVERRGLQCRQRDRWNIT